MPAFRLIIGNKNYSSWSLRAWLTLKQTGSSFTEYRIPLDLPSTAQELATHTPAGRVPTLVVEESNPRLAIWESIAICEYLADTFPAVQLWPQDPHTRAWARSVSAEMHAGFADLRRHMPMDCRNFYPGQGRTPAVQQDIERILDIWQTCRQRFGQSGPFLFGSFSIADAMYAPVISRFKTYDVLLDSITSAYTESVWQLPAMQEWLTAAAAETEVIADP